MNNLKRIYIFDEYVIAKYKDVIEKYNISAYQTIDLDNLSNPIELYYLYEYSDEIQFIAENSLYPSMLNYVKTGLLTEEEMVQALLYK